MVKRKTKKNTQKVEPKVKSKSQKDPIYSWRWAFYILGWINGILSPIFWIIMVVAHFLYDEKGEKFFNNNLRRRVFYWGIFSAVITVLAVILFMASF